MLIAHLCQVNQSSTLADGYRWGGFSYLVWHFYLIQLVFSVNKKKKKGKENNHHQVWQKNPS